MYNKVIGIDISKDTFNAAIFQNEVLKKEGKYKNTEKGIEQFLSKIGEESSLIIEATGTYSLRLSHEAHKQGHRVCIINPKQSSYFSKMMKNITKTDKKDARLLGLYGQRMNPKQWTPPSKTSYNIRQIRNILNSLKKTKELFRNQLHALEQHPYAAAEVMDFYKKEIERLKKEIKKYSEKLTNYTASTYKKQYDLLMSIKGLGVTVVPALIESTNGFHSFDSAKKYTKFLGLCPTYFESGTSVKKTAQICRSGDPKLRSLLYNCTWSAIRFNKACKDLYERLKANNKPSMVALMAVANKLIRQAFGVIKNGKPFNNEFEKNMKVKKMSYTSNNL